MLRDLAARTPSKRRRKQQAQQQQQQQQQQHHHPNQPNVARQASPALSHAARAGELSPSQLAQAFVTHAEAVTEGVDDGALMQLAPGDGGCEGAVSLDEYYAAGEARAYVVATPPRAGLGAAVCSLERTAELTAQLEAAGEL